MSREHVTSPYAQDVRPQPESGPPPRVPVVTQYLVLGSSAATAVLLVVAGLVATLQEDALVSWWESTAVDNGTLDLIYLLGTLTALTNLAAFVATGLWLTDIRRVAEWTSPGTYQRRSGYWAFLGWVVPVVNLWFPFQVVADASRGVGSRVTNFLPWWIAWLALTFYSFVDVPGGQMTTVDDLTTWIRAQQVGAVLAVVALVLWWRVVRSATQGAAAATGQP